jgi:cyclin-dependent kinase 1
MYFRTLSPPTPSTWPEFTQLPDYKPNFPNWSNSCLEAKMANCLDEAGVELLKVRTQFIYSISYIFL